MSSNRETLQKPADYQFHNIQLMSIFSEVKHGLLFQQSLTIHNLSLHFISFNGWQSSLLFYESFFLFSKCCQAYQINFINKLIIYKFSIISVRFLSIFCFILKFSLKTFLRWFFKSPRIIFHVIWFLLSRSNLLILPTFT